MASENQDLTNDEAVSYAPTREEIKGYTPFRTLWAILAFIFGRKLHITALTVVILTLAEAFITFLLTMGGAQAIPRVGGTLALLFTVLLLLLIPHAIYWGYRLVVYPVLWLVSLMFVSEGRAWRAGDLRSPARLTLLVMNAFYYRLTNQVASSLVGSWEKHPRATVLIGAATLTVILYPISSIWTQGSPIHIAFLLPLVFLACLWVVSLVSSNGTIFAPEGMKLGKPLAKLLPQSKEPAASDTAVPGKSTEIKASALAAQKKKQDESYAKWIRQKLAEVEWLRNYYAPARMFVNPQTGRVDEVKRKRAVLRNIISVEVISDITQDPAPKRAEASVSEPENPQLIAPVKIVLNVENNDKAFAKSAIYAIKNNLYFASVDRAEGDFGGTVELIANPIPPPSINLQQTYPYPLGDVSPNLKSVPFGVKQNGHELSVPLYDNHILLGGASGSGKSVSLHSLILGISHIKNTALILIDPKRVELSAWADRATFCVSELSDAANILRMLVNEMDARYQYMTRKGYDSITPEIVASGEVSYIVLVMDELAKILSSGLTEEEKELKKNIILPCMNRLLSEARAAGITIIGATQKPSTRVMPSEIRDNFSLGIALRTKNRDGTKMILGEYETSELPMLPEMIPIAYRGVAVVKGEYGANLAMSYFTEKSEIRRISQSLSPLRVDNPLVFSELMDYAEVIRAREITEGFRSTGENLLAVPPVDISPSGGE